MIGWSVPLGTLGTLGTGGTAGFLVVGIDAQSGLHHQLTLLTYVSTIFIWDLWAAGYRVADLFLNWFGVGVTFVAVLLLWC